MISTTALYYSDEAPENMLGDAESTSKGTSEDCCLNLNHYKPDNILHLAEGSCEKGSSHQEENDRMCPRNGPHARRISVCACLPSISSSNTSLRTTQRKRGATFRLDIYSKKWIVGFFQHDDAAINDSSCVTGEVTFVHDDAEHLAGIISCLFILVSIDVV